MTTGLTVGRKLGLAFAAVLLLLACALYFSATRIDKLRATTVQLKTDSLRKAELAHAAQRYARAQEAGLYGLFLVMDRPARVLLYQSIDMNKAALTDTLKALGDTAKNDDERAILELVVNFREAFQREYDETVDIVELGNDPAARVRMSRLTAPALDALTQRLESLVLLQNKRVDQQIQQSEDAAVQAKQLIALFAMAALLVATLSAIAITRSITHPLGQAVTFADAIAQGKLETPAPAASGGEVLTLVQALDRMRSGIAARDRHVTQLAYFDPLTHLPNRTRFSQRLGEAFGAVEPRDQHFSVMVLNLNRFKAVNDALGYEAGDAVLIAVGQRLNAVLQGTDGMVARQQADEFSLFLPRVGTNEAREFANRVLAAVSQAVEIEGQAVDVDASIGFAMAPEHGTSADRLIAAADHAMISAKRSSHGAVLYDISHALGVKNNLSMLSELRHAVAHDELVLFYQPQLCLRTNVVRRAEVLVRWQHPVRGMVPPDSFIPYAEQTGAIRAVSRWVLDQASAQLAQWRQAGLDVGLCINLSARDLSDPQLPQHVAHLLERHAIPCAQFSLEVTESAAMEDPRQGLLALERLRAMGLRLSIDDFGTGYSSLAYLKQLPVEELKIDKSFVLHMDDDNDDHKIVRSTIDLGHIMDLEVIAEGVETKQSLERLREYGCDFAQGYFVARPMPADRFCAWLEEHRRNFPSAA